MQQGVFREKENTISAKGWRRVTETDLFPFVLIIFISESLESSDCAQVRVIVKFCRKSDYNDLDGDYIVLCVASCVQTLRGED